MSYAYLFKYIIIGDTGNGVWVSVSLLDSPMSCFIVDSGEEEQVRLAS